MIYILHLECSTKICSVALSLNGILLSNIDIEDDGFQHNEKLTLLIDKIIKNNKIDYKNLSAVSISSGPGSHTGLRIASSVAKGLCFSLNIPLLAIPTLEVLYFAGKTKYPDKRILTMIDARRMEVYSSIYDNNFEIKKISADILNENTYIEFNDKTILAIGDGAAKTKELWKNRDIIYDDLVKLSAKYQVELSYLKYKKNHFESTAYFEPLYLKDFINK